MSEIAAITEALSRHRDAPAVLATLVSVEGSSYRRPGARLLLLADGSHVGSISGGCLEEDIKEHARRVLASGCPKIVEYDTTAENDLVWGVGLGCQGVVRVFLERIPTSVPPWVEALRSNLAQRRATALVVDQGGAAPRGTQLAAEAAPTPEGGARFCETIPPPPALAIFGAGDDVRPLVTVARTLGWHVTVADARAVHGPTERFPGADAIVVAPAAELPSRLVLDERSYAVVMTHRYADDLALLRELLPRPLAYLGLLGPRKRTARLLAQLEAEGLVPDDSMLAKLHAPVGLDLGGGTPETVALAIVAEIQARLAGRAGGFLRERRGPIHG